MIVVNGVPRESRGVPTDKRTSWHWQGCSSTLPLVLSPRKCEGVWTNRFLINTRQLYRCFITYFFDHLFVSINTTQQATMPKSCHCTGTWILVFLFVSFTDSLFQSANVDVALDVTVNHANVKIVVHANAIANRVLVRTDRAVSLI